jgi:hypothetical protein
MKAYIFKIRSNIKITTQGVEEYGLRFFTDRKEVAAVLAGK